MKLSTREMAQQWLGANPDAEFPYNPVEIEDATRDHFKGICNNTCFVCLHEAKSMEVLAMEREDQIDMVTALEYLASGTPINHAQDEEHARLSEVDSVFCNALTLKGEPCKKMDLAVHTLGCGDSVILCGTHRKMNEDKLIVMSVDPNNPMEVGAMTSNDQIVVNNNQEVSPVTDDVQYIEELLKEASATEQDNPKEVNNMLYIYETIQTVGDKDGKAVTLPVLVVTNAPKGTELAAYNRFEELAKDNHLMRVQELVKKEFGITMRIKHLGDGRTMPFLQQVVGITSEFRLERYKLKVRLDDGTLMTVIGPDEAPHLHKRIDSGPCVRSWSTSTSTNLLFIKGCTWDSFDQAFKMDTGNSVKFGKRANEYSRVTEMHAFKGWGNKPGDFSLALLNDHVLGEAAYDGQSIISMSFARECIRTNPSKRRRQQLLVDLALGDMTSWIFRCSTPLGLIKGDAIAAPNWKLKAMYGHVPDVITHACNIKPEFKMEGRTLTTLTAQHPHHLPMISAQALSWSKELFVTHDRLKRDFSAYMHEFDTSLEEGKAPKHMLRTIDPHNEDGDFQPNMAKRMLENQVTRFNSTGYNLTNSSYLTARVVQGFLTKVEKDIDRLALPLAWSTMTHCTTHAILLAAGYDVLNRGERMFYHPETGRMCWPTKDFVDNYHRHGGHDLDDTHTTMLRIKEVEPSDNPNMTWDINGKTWCIKAVNLRSPNGLTYFDAETDPGEYSICDIDLGVKLDFMGMPSINFPLYNVYAPIPTLVMSKAPKVQHVQEVEFQEMPSDDIELGEAYSPEDAKRYLDLGMANPGIGTIINAMIAYTVMMGTYPSALPTRLEEMVDCLEQTPSVSGFQLISDAKEDLVEEMVRSGMPIDHFIGIKRLGKKVRNRLGFDRLDKTGPYHLLAQHMTNEYHTLKGKWIGRDQKYDSGLAVTGRVEIEDIMMMDFNIEHMRVANAVLAKFGAERGRAPRNERFRDKATGMMKYVNDPYIAYARREFFIDLNNKLVKMLSYDEEGNEINECMNVLALYKVIITKGVQDNVLFQTGEMHTNDGVFDLFLRAMHVHGLIWTHVEWEDGKAVEA